MNNIMFIILFSMVNSLRHRIQSSRFLNRLFSILWFHEDRHRSCREIPLSDRILVVGFSGHAA